ncbi:uncharacterized protein LAESUDRAFT_650367 [Laetiporus sulphureus 93-53]|uniref:protein-histidine N-methyltransferase n=1 Tax=Laetiporus sulphureus 93-53 TaxID=1314785 RepID=A0A165EYV5_9APHY|nr:uncharacterized protein LAESUDRAFT_650367 [Laetiporus sulphureus 93-53]KZT08004.1 hypothetical protein LAESUDRAFT_650367 [Laetiporus sulphureus 93-53]
MFKFDFDVDDGDPNIPDFANAQPPTKLRKDEPHAEGVLPSEQNAPVVDHLLDELLDALPPAISFSPINIPVGKNDTVILARRDLFDARFQLISLEEPELEHLPKSSSQKESKGRQDLEFLDAPSDLVPGVYEGGLKTWECALDLAGCLDDLLGDDAAKQLRGKRVLELGCGTAIPCLYVLHRLFSVEPTSEQTETLVHMQDYNSLVLRLVTLPNVILAWCEYMSPASLAFRTSAVTEAVNDLDDAFPPADPSSLGMLPITPALIAAFRGSLHAYRVRLRFSSGSWEALADHAKGDAELAYDITLTSETVYRPESLPALVRTLKGACLGWGVRGRSEGGLVKAVLDKLHDDLGEQDGKEGTARQDLPPLCLVAAKRVYFGVGGGVAEFIRAVESSSVTEGEDGCKTKGKVDTIWEQVEGVKRVVMRVTWA